MKGIKHGRPSKKSESVAVGLAKMINDGATVTSACKYFGFDRNTFYNWMKKKRFADAFEAARNAAIDNVETALYRRAVGMPVRKTTRQFDKNGDLLGSTETEEVSLPDARACLGYLQRKRPQEWDGNADVAAGGSADTELRIVIVDEEKGDEKND